MRDKEYYKKIYDLKQWQNIHVNQLSYTRNLFIVLSTSVLAFLISIILDKKFSEVLTCWVKASVIILLFSTFCGIVIAISESENYRKKYKIGRILESFENQFQKLPDDIKREQQCCSKLENVNRILFYFQLGLFSIAIVIISLLLI